MIIKRTGGFILALTVSWVLYCQDYHFSGFMQNIMHVNPAYAAFPSSTEIGLTYRNQWPGIPATFVTYGAAFILPLKSLNSGIGISVINDMQGDGVINRTSAGLMYGYLIELDNDWQIGAGLSAAWVIKDFNADKLVFRSDLLNDLGYSYDPVVYDNYSKNYPDFTIGLILQRAGRLSFGVSAGHITRPKEAASEMQEARLPLRYTAFAGGRLSTLRSGNMEIALEPAAYYSVQRQNHELVWGTGVDFSNAFTIGAWFRQNLRFNFDAFIISAGFSWEKYNINYSYDVNLKKLNFLSTKMAAHEVTFLYRFKYKDQHKVKRFRKSECPAY